MEARMGSVKHRPVALSYWALQELLWLGVDAIGNLRARARAPARTRSPSDSIWGTRLLKIPQGSKTHFVNHICFPITITSQWCQNLLFFTHNNS
jgi:hypothetical protein